MPETAAEQFERGVGELHQVVEHLERSRRRDRFVLAFALVMMLLGGLVFRSIVHEDRRTTQSLCRESNLRFDALLAVLANGVGGDPEALVIIEDMRSVSVVDCDGDGDASDDIRR